MIELVATEIFQLSIVFPAGLIEFGRVQRFLLIRLELFNILEMGIDNRSSRHNLVCGFVRALSLLRFFAFP